MINIDADLENADWPKRTPDHSDDLKIAPRVDSAYRTKLAFLLGGAGSGNFGHAGRPGEVGGSGEGDGAPSAHADLDQKRAKFLGMVESIDAAGQKVDEARVEVNDAWKKWAEDLKNRPRPLKPDGAAAKRLDSYQQAKALEKAFHAADDAHRANERALNAKAKEFLKVPPEDRSAVQFKESAKDPLHPAIARGAAQALDVLRQFDGSGAFVASKFPADQVTKFREAFGEDVPLEENADGTFSIPARLSLSRATDGRARADLTGILVSGGRELDRQVFHEVAHHIEMRSHRALEAAMALREKLADQPREVYKLNTIKPSLGEDEEALRGKFPDPYSAKLYPHDIVTEMISTGVESYMVDPVGFARDRPEHFKLVFDVLHGKYRGEA